MPTIAGILTFISRISYWIFSFEPEFSTNSDYVFVLISAHAPLSAHPGRFPKHVHKRTLLDKCIGILNQFYTLYRTKT